MLKQQFCMLGKDLPRQDFNASARQPGFAAVIGDHRKMPRESVDRVHLLPFSELPALQRRLETTRRHHEKDRSGALLHVIRLDSIQCGEWHVLRSFWRWTELLQRDEIAPGFRSDLLAGHAPRMIPIGACKPIAILAFAED